MTTVTRRVRADEWEQVRELRLAALQDDAAPIAFLETYGKAASEPDEFWQGRTSGGASSDSAAQFVAVHQGAFVGTVTVLVQDAGALDHHGRPVERRRAVVVGVYVRPEHRGSGVVEDLFEAAVQWTRGCGIGELTLDVHSDNARAQAVYRRAGFEPSGESFTGVIGPEIGMVRTL
jgi:ribosomal protein S18 acetylase RimI-like enzyme